MVKLLHLVCGIVPAKQCTASGHVKHFWWALRKVGESTGINKSSKSSIIRFIERSSKLGLQDLKPLKVQRNVIHPNLESLQGMGVAAEVHLWWKHLAI